MPKFSVEVPHTLSKADAHDRLRGFSEKVRQHYAELVKDVEQEWEGDTLHFSFKSVGSTVTGDAKVDENAVNVDGEIPFTMMMFKSKIESVIREEITRLLT